MKKIIVALMIVCVASLAHAGMEQTKIRNQMANALLSTKSKASTTVGYFINVRDKAQTIISHLEASDQAKIPGLKTAVNSAISALNDLISHIDTEFPNLD